jgi:HEPN domain-containing protein
MKKEAKEWLLFADEDLRIAKLALREKIYNQACFHSQQCAEKTLKALIENKTKVPKVHSLFELLEVCKEQGYKLEKLRTSLEFLDKFYTSARYPFVIRTVRTGRIRKKDAEKALRTAEKIFQFGKTLLNIK